MTGSKRGSGRTSAAREGRADGVSMIELLIMIAVLGIALAATMIAWNQSRGRAEAKSAARLAKIYIHKARMNSIFQGVNHFVVLNPATRRLEIYADTGTTPASFDDADPLVEATSLKVDVSLPSGPIDHPLDAGAVSDAWDLPLPDEEARWGKELFGLMTTPTGLVQSAEATPATIGTGVIVFSDAQSNTSAVSIRGREGGIRSFHYLNAKWKEM